MTNSNNSFKTPRGAKDLIGDQYLQFKSAYDFIYQKAFQFGFDFIETPIFEIENTFKNNLGDTTDIIKNEIYQLQQKGSEKLVLRPEFTAAVARAFYSNKIYTKQKAISLFSFGPLFRYDRPQAGRQRQFWQANFEKIGFKDCTSEIELIMLGYNILKNYTDNFKLEINHLCSADTILQYKKVISKYFEKHKELLSKTSQERIYDNPLRILDSKDLKDQQITSNAPKISELYSDTTKKELKYILSSLENLGIPTVINHNLVRGLDYYTGIVFEFKYTCNESASQNTILAGGRYDNLIGRFTNQNTPAVGMAVGIERLLLCNTKQKLAKAVRIGIVSSNSESYIKTINSLTSNKIPVLTPPTHLSIKEQFIYLEHYQTKYAIILNQSSIEIKNILNGKKEHIKNIEEFISNQDKYSLL